MKKQRINQIYQIRFVENNLLKSICFNSTFILPLFKKIKWNSRKYRPPKSEETRTTVQLLKKCLFFVYSVRNFEAKTR